MRNYLILFLFLYSIGGNAWVYGQLRVAKTPRSFNETRTLNYTTETYSFFPTASKSSQYSGSSNSKTPFQIAQMIDVDLCMGTSGQWDTLSTGELFWHLKITAPGALGIYLTYSNFYLPSGSEFYLYSANKQHVIGAFTQANNHPSGKFATEIIPSDACILEYYPGKTTEKATICIDKLAYVYRGIDQLTTSRKKSSSTSTSCQKTNINCSPEGDNWDAQKHAVAKLIVDGYQCTGTLLNNTAGDFRNFFATAFHCIDGHEAALPTSIYYFNYYRNNCSDTSNINTYLTLTGAELRAKIPLSKGGDGALLELTGTIPANSDIYWAGWNIDDSIIGMGACLHHPAGLPQKISTIRSVWKSATWSGDDGVIGAEDAHWNVAFEVTNNGYGNTEDGSSGAGLFGPDGLFRGVLSGGLATCTDPTLPNLFGKLSYNWDKYATTSDKQFKYWLDPKNTGAKTLKGISKLDTLNINWKSTAPVIPNGGIVKFTDISEGEPTAWAWKFEGGTPDTSNEQSPSIHYKTSGLYAVTMEIKNSLGTYVRKRTNYVYVYASPFWITQNSGFKKPYRGIAGFSIVDSLNLFAWAFDGLKPAHYILEYTRTQTGGRKWTADSIVMINTSGYGISHMFALSQDTIFATIFMPSNGGKLIKTFDGGKNWTNCLPNAFLGTSACPNFVHFFDKKNGICIGDPNNGYFEIYLTNDKGENWQRVPEAYIPDTIKNETLGTVGKYTALGNSIWFGTSKGRVFSSSNKGISWKCYKTGLSFVTDVNFNLSYNDTIGFAINTLSSYAVYKSLNAGRTWSEYTIPETCIKGFWARVPKKNNTWVVVSSNTSSGSSYTNNNGSSFVLLDKNIQYTTASFFDIDAGWAGGYNSDSLSGGIYRWNRLNRDPYSSYSGTEQVIGKTTNRYSVYPNPVVRKVSIEGNWPNNTKLRVHSMQGTLIYEKNIAHEQIVDIDFSPFPNGVYTIIIQNTQATESHKVLHISE